MSLLRLVSPALPVGGYSYSRGLEQAVERGWVHDAETTFDWISAVVGRSTARTDAPAVHHLYAAFLRDDQTHVDRWARTLAALRETSELWAEEHGMGESLARLLVDLGHAEASRFLKHPDRSFAVTFALAATLWGISVQDAVTGYLWVVCEGQVSAAVRLIPLGQTDGQRILGRLNTLIPAWSTAAGQLGLDDIGGFLPGVAMASAHHEQQYSRLFRS
ncbi:MAG: urease accessory protein [Myxococcota bacterium]